MILTIIFKFIGNKGVYQVQKLGLREASNGEIYFKLIGVVESIPSGHLYALDKIRMKYPTAWKDSRIEPGHHVPIWFLERISGLKSPACKDWAKENDAFYSSDL